MRLPLFSQKVIDVKGKWVGVAREGKDVPAGWKRWMPHFRCDNLAFGASDPEVEDRVGGCTNTRSKRVFVMSTRPGTEFPEVAKHIKDVLNPATNKNTFPPKRPVRAALPAADALAAFLREMVDHMDTHQGLARTLATLMSTGSDTLAEVGRALEQAVTDLVAAAVRDGAVRDDVVAGAVMMALHGIGAAHDRPNWRAEADDVITLVLDGLRPSQPTRAATRTPGP